MLIKYDGIEYAITITHGGVKLIHVYCIAIFVKRRFRDSYDYASSFSYFFCCHHFEECPRLYNFSIFDFFVDFDVQVCQGLFACMQKKIIFSLNITEYLCE